jgi:RNA polymerase sigma-70 factor (ECF subfamily)
MMEEKPQEKVSGMVERAIQDRIGIWAQSSGQKQEDSWVKASQNGDTLAFNRLVLKWEKTVFNIALRMLREREEAAEATQEIFFRAYRNIDRFRQKSRFSAWIYRIALNHCISRIRQRPPGIHLSLDEQKCAVNPPKQLHVTETQLDQVMRSEECDRVLGALAYLTPEQRAVIELKFFQGMTFEDIAGILEIPLSTTKSRLYSGLGILKVHLAEKT